MFTEPEYSLRQVELIDLESVMAIEAQAFPLGIQEPRETFVQRLNVFPQGFYVLVDHRDACIGYIASEIWQGYTREDFQLGHSIADLHNPQGRLLYISSTGILPSHRGKGLGKVLLKGLLAETTTLYPNLESSILLVSAAWKQAREIYRQEGYHQQDIIPGFFQPHGAEAIDGVVMVKDLMRSDIVRYRNATLADILKVSALQQRYHVSTISDEDRPDGFVTTLFTEEQFAELIEKENGLAIACAGENIVGYAMAASWQYWSLWPLFQHMIKELPSIEYLGQRLTTENSYQYGPICIHRDYRGTEVLANLFEFSRQQMENRYPIMITFINQINPRSLKAHSTKLDLEIIKPFEFNDNQYYLLGYDTSKETPNQTLT